MPEKIVKLKINGDFRRAYARGKVYSHPALVAYVVKNRAGKWRMGITAGKKIGTAVKRNRAKRIIFAAFSSLAPELIPGGRDIVFVARTRILDLKSTDVEKIMRKQLMSAGLFVQEQIISGNEFGG